MRMAAGLADLAVGMRVAGVGMIVMIVVVMAVRSMAVSMIIVLM